MWPSIVKSATVVLALSFAATALSAQTDVWVSLTEPPGANAPSEQRSKVLQQQDAVMAQLRDLGGIEIARVKISRNALAITIDSSKLAEVKKIPGVRSVAPVRHIERDPQPRPDPVR